MKSVSGYFTVLGLADEPFTYEVSVVRTGKNYSVRNVNVRRMYPHESRLVSYQANVKQKKTIPQSASPASAPSKTASPTSSTCKKPTT